MKEFRSPADGFAGVGSLAAARIAAAAADIALIIGPGGEIADVAVQKEELAVELREIESWIGRPWAQTATPESGQKIEDMVRAAAAGAPVRWRQINHPAVEGPDIPVQYVAVPLGLGGRAVAIGRDQRQLSRLQQQLVEAQQAVEEDYARLRQAETRYRLLFERSNEALMVVDAATLRVIESNLAARQCVPDADKGLVGRSVADAFDQAGARAVQSLLAGVRAAGRADDVRAQLAQRGQEVLVSASLFREGKMALCLVRLTPLSAPDGSDIVPARRAILLSAAEGSPDAILVADDEWRIMSANAAFVEMANLASEHQARGEPASRWLGRPGADLDVLAVTLRQRGIVRQFATVLRSEHSPPSDVEVSAASLPDGQRQHFVLTIRMVPRRRATEGRTARDLARSAGDLAELVGRVALKDLVRETTDAIEKLYIEAALEVTGDNRASAAEMLGLSRQSLYVKLRRYGIDDVAVEDEMQS